MNQKATIKVPSLKLTLPLRPNQLPADLVPMDGPAGEPILELVLEGSPLTIVAKINGKNYRKMTKTVGSGQAIRAHLVKQSGPTWVTST